MGQHRQLPERLRAAPPEVPHAVHRDRRLRLRSPALTILPGQADFLGTIYAFGAMLSFTIAHVVGDRAADQGARPRAALHGARQRSRIRGRKLPLFALVGGAGTGIAWVVVTVLNIEHADRRHGLARDRDRDATCSTGATRACRSPRRRRSWTRSRSSSTRSSTSRCSSRSRTRQYSPEAVATAVQARRAAAARDPRARDDHACRRARRSTRRCPSRRRARRRRSTPPACSAAGA